MQIDGCKTNNNNNNNVSLFPDEESFVRCGK